jgi:hypothetical protein
MFWPQQDYDNLKQLLEDPVHEKTNLIVLRADIHTLWDNHRFCLRPIDGLEDNTMGLEFLSLNTSQHEKAVMNFLAPVATAREIALSGGGDVHSGDRILLRTEDLQKYPLPGRLFLQLQYNLHRALCASAAAEVISRVFRRDPDPPKVLANNDSSSDTDCRSLMSRRHRILPNIS